MDVQASAGSPYLFGSGKAPAVPITPIFSFSGVDGPLNGNAGCLEASSVADGLADHLDDNASATFDCHSPAARTIFRPLGRVNKA